MFDVQVCNYKALCAGNGEMETLSNCAAWISGHKEKGITGGLLESTDARVVAEQPTKADGHGQR